jgi:hypothetical protein
MVQADPEVARQRVEALSEGHVRVEVPPLRVAHGEHRQGVAEETVGTLATEARGAVGHGEGDVEGDGRPLAAPQRPGQGDAQGRAPHGEPVRRAAVDVRNGDG